MTSSVSPTTMPPDIEVIRHYPTFEDREFAMNYLSRRVIGFAFARAGDKSLEFKVKWRDGIPKLADYDTLTAHFLPRYRELNPGAFIDGLSIQGE